MRRIDAARRAPFWVAYLEEAQARGTPDGDQLLAQIRYAETAPDQIKNTCDITVPLVQLGDTPLIERWYCNPPLRSGFEYNIAYRKSKDVLFGYLLLREDAFFDLGTATYEAYRHIASLVSTQRYPYILRIWNYFPEINAHQNSRERYQRFCEGRGLALDAFNYRNAFLPAACAIGTCAPGLRIYFLAACEPGVQVENPRQMSAFQYPEQYGPRSPAFSRAIVKRWEHNRHLYISGTASITDHRSRHVGDSLGQLNETMANLEALVAAADKADSVVFSLTDRSVLKVYVRHGQDEAEIRRWLRDVMGFRASIIILRGDICRRELLVEIEGILAA